MYPIAALQIEYNPFALFIEDESIALLKTARELGVAIVAYSPLARGLITGRFVCSAPSLDAFILTVSISHIRNLLTTLKKATSEH